jgi:hypothetical protein
MKPEQKKLQRSLYLSLGIFSLIAAISGYLIYGNSGAITAFSSILCLALGFWITESLIGVFTGVKKANSTAIVLLFSGKLAWWVGIFWASRILPKGSEPAVAIGLGSFLLALLLAGVLHYGLPKISDA